MLEAAAAAVKRARQTTSMYGASGLDQKGLIHLLLLFAHFMLNISINIFGKNSFGPVSCLVD